MRFLSPAYALCRALVCSGDMNSSSFPAINKAGMNALLTWFLSGLRSLISNFALDEIVLLIIAIAPDIINLGILVCYLHRSSASYLRLENGESRTSPAIDGSLSACISAVTAPILRPYFFKKSKIF